MTRPQQHLRRIRTRKGRQAITINKGLIKRKKITPKKIRARKTRIPLEQQLQQEIQTGQITGGEISQLEGKYIDQYGIIRPTEGPLMRIQRKYEPTMPLTEYFKQQQPTYTDIIRTQRRRYG